MIHETVIKSVSELMWLWFVIEPNDKDILAVDVQKSETCFFTERILFNGIYNYGMYYVSFDSCTK